MAVPFLNWLVDIMREYSPSKRLVVSAVLSTAARLRRRDIIAQFLRPSGARARAPAKTIPDRRARRRPCLRVIESAPLRLLRALPDRTPSSPTSARNCGLRRPLTAPGTAHEHVTDRGHVTPRPHTGDHRIDRRRNDRHAPPLLPGMNVRQVNLNLGYICRFQGVMQRVRVVRPRPGVDDQSVGTGRFTDEPDHLSLEIGLPEL